MVCEVGGSPNGVAAPCFPDEPPHDDDHIPQRTPSRNRSSSPDAPYTTRASCGRRPPPTHLLGPIERGAYGCSSNSCRIIRACKTSTPRCTTPTTLRLRRSGYPRPFCPDLPPCAWQKVFDPPPPLRFGQSVSFRHDPPHWSYVTE